MQSETHRTYTVAGHSFSLEIPESGADLDKVLAAYTAFEGGQDPLFRIIFRQSGTNTARFGKYINRFNPEPPYVHVFDCDSAHVFGFSASEEKIDLMVSVSHDLKEGIVEMDSLDNDADLYFAVCNAVMLMYAMSTFDKDTLLIHASAVCYQNSGYAFTAPSGTGKSTHSRLWTENIQDARLLNDDNPVVRVIDGSPVIFGSPWSGKTPCYRNESYPLKAIINLHQAPENRIEQLKGIKAYASFHPSCSCMRWNRQIADGVNRTIEKLLGCCSFYRLDCLPNAEAATLCCTQTSGTLPETKTSHTPDNLPNTRKAKVKSIPNPVIIEEVHKLISEGKNVTLAVKGQSMLPFIRGEADSVLLEKCTSPAAGDILLCKVSEGQYVLHRAISVSPHDSGKEEASDITLMGDGNLIGREYCTGKDIIAKAVKIIRPDGTETDCRSKTHKRKARLWQALLPIRRYLLAICRRIPSSRKKP